jgi:hypothetical protein
MKLRSRKRDLSLTIFGNSGLGATSKEVTGLDGRREWVNPLVKAKGKLVYSKGRMGRAYGEKEWEAFGATLSSEEAV